MAASEEQPRDEHRPAGLGPGERLQAARIQQGLSIDDVANRMHLSTSILEAIEENNFDEITAPIFVKGYLRAYARIVSLDEDELIQQYMDYYSGEDPPISSTSNMAPELSVADARIKWTTYAVIVVLAALLAAWWWNKEQQTPEPISLDTQSETASETMASVPVTDSSIEAVSENQMAAADSETMSQPEVAEAEPMTEPDPVEVEAETEAPATTVAAVEAESEEVVTITEVAAPEATESVEGPVTSQIAPSGSDRLQVIVHADTWADIKDNSDYQMVYDLLRADQSLELVGQAPFSVFLGNGHGVEIRFNDEEVDLTQRIRDDNTARLKIGG